MPTASEIRALLKRLDGEPADALESQVLDFKPWNPDPKSVKEQIREFREHVVCFANAQGGTIVVGVADRKRTRKEAIHGVANLADLDHVRRQIYNGTEPPILVDIEEVLEPEGRLLLIHVPRGLPPHLTTEGLGKIRIGKDCQPLRPSHLTQMLAAGGSRDLTAERIPESSLEDIDPVQVKRLRDFMETEGREHNRPHLLQWAQKPTEELLRNLEVLREDALTWTGILLLGRSAALARWASQHEVVFLDHPSQTSFDDRHNLKGPLFGVLDALEKILAHHVRIQPVQTDGFAELSIPDLSWQAAREAILNALVHRDWFVRQSIQVDLYRDRFEVFSPGGLIGGVTPENILRHGPVRRNHHFADVLEKIGLVNRAGMGVDRIYENLLWLGKGLPRYETDEASVRVSLPLRTHQAFARFVAQERREGRDLELDELILLRGLAERGVLDRWSAGERLQLDPDEAADRLVRLRERGFVVPHGRGRGTAYHLTPFHARLLRTPADADLDLPLDDEAVRLRIQVVLAERNRLTNADVRRISGYSRTEVLRLMRRLRDDGLVAFSGRGRAAHFVAGPALRRTGNPTRKGRK